MTIETGVYCITNLKNIKMYVGGAYRSFKERWRTHRSSLRTGKHFNPHLQAAWNKYGEAWFLFEIIERCGPDKDVIQRRETCWIKALEAINPKKGYNRSETSLGGKRPGSGRKKHPEPLITVSVRISREDLDFLKSVGNGNRSRGLRSFIDESASLIDSGAITPPRCRDW